MELTLVCVAVVTRRIADKRLEAAAVVVDMFVDFHPDACPVAASATRDNEAKDSSSAPVTPLSRLQAFVSTSTSQHLAAFRDVALWTHVSAMDP